MLTSIVICILLLVLLTFVTIIFITVLKSKSDKNIKFKFYIKFSVFTTNVEINSSTSKKQSKQTPL